MKEYVMKLHLSNGKYTMISVLAKSKEEAVKLAKPTRIEVALVTPVKGEQE